MSLGAGGVSTVGFFGYWDVGAIGTETKRTVATKPEPLAGPKGACDTIGVTLAINSVAGDVCLGVLGFDVFELGFVIDLSDLFGGIQIDLLDRSSLACC